MITAVDTSVLLIEVVLPLNAISAASVRKKLSRKNVSRCNINAINQISICFFTIFLFLYYGKS